MKPKIIIRIVMFLISVGNICSTGCKKDNVDTDPFVVIDNSTAENAFNDLFTQVDKAVGEISVSGAEIIIQPNSKGSEKVHIIPFDTLTFPKTLTIDLGSSNCLCTDGKYRWRQIIAVLNGKYSEEGNVIAVSLSDYYINNNHIQGRKSNPTCVQLEPSVTALT